MRRPTILLLQAALAVSPLIAADDAADTQLLAKAKALQKKVIAIDCHVDLPFEPLRPRTAKHSSIYRRRQGAI